MAIRDRIYNLCLKALHTDGSHHKQWYLEQILKEVLNIDLKDFKKENDWEEGIAPWK